MGETGQQQTVEQSGWKKRAAFLAGALAVGVGVVYVAAHAVAEWHGMPLGPIHLEPIQSPEYGSMLETAKHIGSTLLHISQA